MKPSRLSLLLLAAVAVLLLAVTLVLPMVVDVQRYRGWIEGRVEQTLGRDVRLGEMRLSLLPVLGLRIDDVAIEALPEEGDGDLLSARTLRVGVRFMPLLRKRLEVTSLVLQEPSALLVRDEKGRWNVERLLTDRQSLAAEKQTPERPAGSISVTSLRIRDARVLLRDAGSVGVPVEITLEGLDLELEGLAPGQSFEFRLSTGFVSAPESRARLRGEAGPLLALGEQRSRLSARAELEKAPPAVMAALAAFAGFPLSELLGDRAFDASLDIDADLSPEGTIRLSQIRLVGLDLSVQRFSDGSWNLWPAKRDAEPAESPSRSIQVAGLVVEDATVRLTDATVAPEPLQVALEDLEAELDRLPWEETARLRIASGLVVGADRGRLEISGDVGPWRDGPQELPVAVSVAVDALPADLIPLLLPASLRVSDSVSPTRVALDLEGELPQRFRVSGGLDLGRVTVRMDGAGGRERSASVSLAARFQAEIASGGERLTLDLLALQVDEQSLEVRGQVAREGGGSQVDLTLAPTRLATDDLAALVALLVEDPPFTFSSPSPVELAGRIYGRYSETELPQAEGRLSFRDLSLRHRALSEPVEALSGEVTFVGRRVEARGLEARVGSSDLRGALTLEGFTYPQVRIDLASQEADLGELLSLLETEAPQSQAGAAASSLLEAVQAGGSIRVQRGSWDSLRFSDLQAELVLVDGVLTLDPVSMRLYDGRFSGRVISDLRQSPPPFEMQGEAEGVDVAPFLNQNLGIRDRLVGRFSGEVDLRGAGGDPETLIRSLAGGGSARVDQGRLVGLTLLRSVSRAAGIFGQRSLANIADELSDESTMFDRFEGNFRLSEGRLELDSLAIDSPKYSLRGRSRVDLLAATLAGELRIAFSRELSELMNLEGSRAGQIFWDRDRRQVVLPLSLSGSFEEPSAKVDWDAAVKGYARRTAEQELLRLLKKLAPSDEEPGPAPTPAPESAPAPPTATRDASSLKVEVTRAYWGGSFLAQDLKLEGSVQGAGIVRASMKVTDAEEREVARIERIPDVERFLAAAADPAAPAVIPWKARVDGKELLLVTFPLTVIVTVVDANAEAAEVSLVVER